MKPRLLRPVLASLAAVTVALLTGGSAHGATPRVLLAKFDNDINPITADYLTDEIDRANKRRYDAIVIELDTPGGLVDSMNKVVKKELESKVPVVVYIAPQGAGAGSAGVFISQAADVLAMAPQTTIGAATPISDSGNLPSDLRRKAINFYASKARALAATHGRNGTWADSAVRKASSRTANEAIRQNIADVLAPSVPALLAKIDGLKTKPKGVVLHTKGAELTTVSMGFWKRLLDLLIDPNLIALMLSLGVLGIVIELWHPGLIFPATFGVLCLAIGFYGLDVLPISWAGVVLLVAAFAFWITELFIAFSHGALTVAGAVCFVFGSLLLFEPAGSGYQVSLSVALAVAGMFSLFFAFALAKIVQIRRRPASVGTHTIVGAHGQVRRDGLVAVRGELWQARTDDGEPLEVGDEVDVVEVEGLSLVVRRAREHATV
ncbi:MAG TPA: nodulation protein NfeD [Gaiellaceae bacterium]|nr:nodulation protein NfeD [Gaiellaceae bacterium]